jgi:hypothetical protein
MHGKTSLPFASSLSSEGRSVFQKVDSNCLDSGRGFERKLKLEDSIETSHRAFPKGSDCAAVLISKVLSIEIEYLLLAHDGYFDMLTKLRCYLQAGTRVFVDPAGYEQFVEDAQETFRKAFNEQEAAVPG